MMLPAQVTAVPLYVMFAKLHLVGTLAPLIIPSFFGDAFSIFLLRQFLLTIPQEYVDAARVDGAGEWRILLRIVVPLAKPAIAAVGAVQLPLRVERLLRPTPVRRRELQRRGPCPSRWPTCAASTTCSGT